jgi:hypothetical protein
MFHASNRTTIRSPEALLAGVASRGPDMAAPGGETAFEEHEQSRPSRTDGPDIIPSRSS